MSLSDHECVSRRSKCGVVVIAELRGARLDDRTEEGGPRSFAPQRRRELFGFGGPALGERDERGDTVSEPIQGGGPSTSRAAAC